MQDLLSRKEEALKDEAERIWSGRIKLVQEHNYVSVLTIQAYRQPSA